MKKNIFLLFIIFQSFLACVGDVDFSQTDDIAIDNEGSMSFFYFTLINNQLLDSNNNEILNHNESFNTPFLSDIINPDYTKKVKIYLLINNTFDRSFILKLQTFDSQGLPSLAFDDLFIPQDSIYFEHEYINNATDMETLKEVSKIDIMITLNPSITTIQPYENKQLDIKSTLTFSNTFNVQ